METRVQNPAEREQDETYFAIFGLPRKLHLDTAELEQSFYRLSRKLHPDLFARKSAEEQAWSLRRSSLLNDAYRTLKEPVARTAYLLLLEGVRLDDENAESRDAKAKQNRIPADLLEEVFELNMQLEEMRSNATMGEDDASLRVDLEREQAQFASMLAAVDEELRAAWTAWDTALDASDEAAKTKQQDRMVTLLDRRSYLRNLLHEVETVLVPHEAPAGSTRG